MINKAGDSTLSSTHSVVWAYKKKTCYDIGELSTFREVMRLTLLRYSKTQMFSSVRAKRKTGLSIRAL